MRISTRLVVILILLNASAGFVTASGIGQDWGIDPHVGGGDQVDTVNQQSDQLRPGAGTAETLFTLFTSLAKPLVAIFQLVFYGPTMLVNLGFPLWLMTFLFAPATFLVARDIYYALTGRDL